MAGSREYFAFLSYSHDDKGWADWLHRSLENFRTPREMVGRESVNGKIPARLTPIFRDRDELPASSELGETLNTALAASRFLIVLCSPTAAQSRWTNEEIVTFKRLHPDGRVLAAIVGGEPFAELPENECFPPALKHRFDAKGALTEERSEVIAADLRDEADGKRLGFLKLVAGMFGVGLDELVRREDTRRQRRLAIISAASVAGMAVTSGLALFAFDARDEARDQRREAEKLVGFMLGDLRGRLEPLGRLDALDSVGAKALDYYQGQDKGTLTEEGLALRARALTLIGEIANLRGDLDGALARYNEALGGTGEALRRDPDNAQRVFDHAQNVFWVGALALQRGQTNVAEARYFEYKRLAERMVELDPDEPEWRLEIVYAETNLGTLMLEENQFARAVKAFESAEEMANRLVAAEPRNRRYRVMVTESLAYLSDAQRSAGRLDQALESRERQLALLGSMASEFGNDADLKRKSMVAQRMLGALFVMRGEPDIARDHLERAVGFSEELRGIEPDNTEWLAVTAGVQTELAGLLLATGDLDEADRYVRSSCEIARRLVSQDKSVVEWRVTRIGECLKLRAQSAAHRGHDDEALSLAREVLTLNAESRKAPDPQAFLWTTPMRLLVGDQLAGANRSTDARTHWSAGLAGLEKFGSHPTAQSWRYMLLRRLGRDKEAAATAARLDAMGYRHPNFLKARRSSMVSA